MKTKTTFFALAGLMMILLAVGLLAVGEERAAVWSIAAAMLIAVGIIWPRSGGKSGPQ